jgi:hypothetical protein
MTVVRGASVPSGWTGTMEQYLETVFAEGARVVIGKVASASTGKDAAPVFARGDMPYMMVIRTRDGLPVASISAIDNNFETEDQDIESEVVIPPGTQLRCVRVDRSVRWPLGYGAERRMPTVYLVAEDLVAEADANAQDNSPARASASETRLDKALKDWTNRYFNVGDLQLQLGDTGIRHILKRHHPDYWDGSMKEKQNFFMDRPSIDQIAERIGEVLQQNRDDILAGRVESVDTMFGYVDGVRYQLGIKHGYIGQFFPADEGS